MKNHLPCSLSLLLSYLKSLNTFLIRAYNTGTTRFLEERETINGWNNYFSLTRNKQSKKQCLIVTWFSQSYRYDSSVPVIKKDSNIISISFSVYKSVYLSTIYLISFDLIIYLLSIYLSIIHLIYLTRSLSPYIIIYRLRQNLTGGEEKSNTKVSIRSES